MRTNYKRIKNLILSNFDCQIEESRTRGIVAVFDEGLETEQRVRVVLVNGSECQNEIGCHIRRLSKDDLEYHLRDSIETALKDSFPTVWVHQKSKPSKEWRELRMKQAQDWFNALEKRVESRHTLNKLEVDPMSVLQTMDQDQLELLVLCLSAANKKGHSESREWWSKAYHSLRAEKQVGGA